jgi:hypothetical protein
VKDAKIGRKIKGKEIQGMCRDFGRLKRKIWNRNKMLALRYSRLYFSLGIHNK